MLSKEISLSALRYRLANEACLTTSEVVSDKLEVVGGGGLDRLGKKGKGRFGVSLESFTAERDSQPYNPNNIMVA